MAKSLRERVQKKVRSKSYNAFFQALNFPVTGSDSGWQYHAVICQMLPYEDEVRFYEELDENIFLMKLIPGIRPRVLQSILKIMTVL